MKLPPYVKKRGNVYWFRRRVSDELIHLIGRGEFAESLWTTDLDTAKTRAAFRNAEVEALFEQARFENKRQAGTVLVGPPTPEEQQYIRDAVRFHVLDEDESVRLARPDEGSMEAYEDYRSTQFDDVVAGLRSGRVAWGPVEKSRISRLLSAIGVQVEPGTPAWQLAAYRASEGLQSALKDIGRRASQEHVVTPARPLLPPTLVPAAPTDVALAPAGITLGDVIDHYMLGLPANDFKRKVRRCLQLFGEMVGRDLKVGELRQKAVTQFLRDICRLPDQWARRFDAGESIAAMLDKGAEKVMSPTTYEGNYRAPLGTFLTSAAQNFGDDGLRLLSVDGIRYTGNRVPEEDQQRALLDDELKVLFEGDAFARVASDPNSEPLYWLLVVMLYTGARPREVCQINPQVDFGEFEGAWFIDLDNKSAAGVGVKKSIKTGEARRVPLHAEMVRLGFPEYLQRAKEAGVDRLFPSWRVKAGNPFTAHHGLIAGLLKETGLYTRTAPAGEQVTGAYVLRKTFVTQCRNQGVVSREITGHRDGTTTVMQDRHYIFGPEPFGRKLRELGKLVMPVGIPLPGHTKG